MHENLDKELIAPFKKRLHKDNLYQFFVVHLAGSHVPYNDKYDEEDLKQVQNSPEEYREYDASVHHTDKVIEAIYRELEPLNSWIIVYMPDHGEVVNIGHGLEKLGRKQLEIPMIAIGDKKAISKFKDVIVGLTDKNGTFNTVNTIYAVSSMMRYQFTEKAITETANAGEYVYHVDNRVYSISALK